MIRRAVEDDVPSLVEMAREFHAMAPHNPMGVFDPVPVCRLLTMMIGSPTALVLTNGEGAIGGFLAPVYFNTGKTLMDESFWWARKGGRDLLRAFCDEAKAMGADFVILSTLENDRHAVIDRVVRAAGFKPVERRYMKGFA